jgi:hypothetical protein
MGQLLNAKELKEQASIFDLLSRLGFEPVKKYGKEYMYRSMLRDGDNTPSFSVDDKIGGWYDHGTGKGGNIIDFGLAFWSNLTFNEVVEKIQTACNIQADHPKRECRPRLAVKVRNYSVQQTKDIGTHPAITNYLRERGIFDIAVGKLREVYYSVQDDNGVKKGFFAAGWQNERGSWEVRNKYFKGCLGSKALSFIPGDAKHAVLFEGYLNYLSWLAENQHATQSIIILNTLSLLSQGIERAKEFSSIDVFFDRDPSGFQASRKFISALPYASDRSSAFEGFNDYNDKLVSSLRSTVPQGPFERKRSGYGI